MVKAFVLYGSGLGCHQEVAHAYEKAGAKAELVHINQLLSGEKSLRGAQILDPVGGFLQGDMLGAGMCAANEIEHAVINGLKLKDLLWDFAERGNIIYAQCNGFQVLVKLGLLPAIGDKYERQTVTLTHNDCANYRESHVFHKLDRPHFAFEGIEQPFLLSCRHGEGKLVFYSPHGSIPEGQAKETRRLVNERHVLLRYVTAQGEVTTDFPDNPNRSVDGIAGLVNEKRTVFGHMAHPEVSVYATHEPQWFKKKDQLRRKGTSSTSLVDMPGVGQIIFKNIVKYFG